MVGNLGEGSSQALGSEETRAISSGEAFVDFVINTPMPDGSPNTNIDWISEPVILSMWDTAMQNTEASPKVEGKSPAVVQAMAAWWASGAVHGYIVAKSEEAPLPETEEPADESPGT